MGVMFDPAVINQSIESSTPIYLTVPEGRRRKQRVYPKRAASVLAQLTKRNSVCMLAIAKKSRRSFWITKLPNAFFIFSVTAKGHCFGDVLLSVLKYKDCGSHTAVI